MSADSAIEPITSHTSFKGEQRKYRGFAEPLGRTIDLEIYVPLAQLRGAPCVVVYYLPSLQTNAWLVASQSDYQRYANRYDTILVIPDLFSGYSGSEAERVARYWAERERIETYLLGTLPEVIDHHFSAYDIRSIMGYGFGGTLALDLALKNRLLYRSASALAPWLGFYGTPWFEEHFAGLGIGAEIDPVQWFATHGNARVVPIWIDQGDQDDYLGRQIQLHKLEELIAVHPQREELLVNWRKRYDHSFYFVHSHIREHFVFHAEFHENL